MSNTEQQLKNIIEAAIMAAGEPLSIDRMMSLFVEDNEPPTRDAIKDALQCITEESAERGVELKKINSGYRFQSKQDYSPWISRLWEEKPARYSRALLETLVLIAYKQPITRGEIEHVRGVAVSSHIIKTLQERDWVRVVGHRDVPGKPAIYATTRGFLDYFNLASLDELPTLAEIRDLDKISAELDLQQTDTNAEQPASAGEAPPNQPATEDEGQVAEQLTLESNLEANLDEGNTPHDEDSETSEFVEAPSGQPVTADTAARDDGSGDAENEHSLEATLSEVEEAASEVLDLQERLDSACDAAVESLHSPGLEQALPNNGEQIDESHDDSETSASELSTTADAELPLQAEVDAASDTLDESLASVENEQMTADDELANSEAQSASPPDPVDGITSMVSEWMPDDGETSAFSADEVTQTSINNSIEESVTVEEHEISQGALDSNGRRPEFEAVSDDSETEYSVK